MLFVPTKFLLWFIYSLRAQCWVKLVCRQDPDTIEEMNIWFKHLRLRLLHWFQYFGIYYKLSMCSPTGYREEENDWLIVVLDFNSWNRTLSTRLKVTAFSHLFCMFMILIKIQSAHFCFLVSAKHESRIHLRISRNSYSCNRSAYLTYATGDSLFFIPLLRVFTK